MKPIEPGCLVAISREHMDHTMAESSLVWSEDHLECRGCGSIPGQHHAPECPCVDAFTAGRIPGEEDGQ